MVYNRIFSLNSDQQRIDPWKPDRLVGLLQQPNTLSPLAVPSPIENSVRR